MLAEITMSKGITLNMGNYEGNRYDVTVRLTVPEGESKSGIGEHAEDLCHLSLVDTVSRDCTRAIDAKIAAGGLPSLNRSNPYLRWLEIYSPATFKDIVSRYQKQLAALDETEPIAPTQTDGTSAVEV